MKTGKILEEVGLSELEHVMNDIPKAGREALERELKKSEKGKKILAQRYQNRKAFKEAGKLFEELGEVETAIQNYIQEPYYYMHAIKLAELSGKDALEVGRQIIDTKELNYGYIEEVIERLGDPNLVKNVIRRCIKDKNLSQAANISEKFGFRKLSRKLRKRDLSKNIADNPRCIPLAMKQVDPEFAYALLREVTTRKKTDPNLSSTFSALGEGIKEISIDSPYCKPFCEDVIKYYEKHEKIFLKTISKYRTEKCEHAKFLYNLGLANEKVGRVNEITKLYQNAGRKLISYFEKSSSIYDILNKEKVMLEIASKVDNADKKKLFSAFVMNGIRTYKEPRNYDQLYGDGEFEIIEKYGNLEQKMRMHEEKGDFNKALELAHALKNDKKAKLYSQITELLSGLGRDEGSGFESQSPHSDLEVQE